MVKAVTLTNTCSCIIAILLCLLTLAEARTARANGCDDGTIASEVTQELYTLYRTQTPEGALEFRGMHSFFETYPMLATFTLDVHRTQPSAVFISQSSAAAARYYGYLFTHRDRNSNLLIETALRFHDGSVLTGIEDPGFNALLSLDMISLARLNLEIRKPLTALYWYEGARTLQERIVDRCFDIDTNYFFPYDTNVGALRREYFALSVAPLLFEGNVGDNHAGALIQHYVLRRAEVDPEPPSLFFNTGAPSAEEVMDLLFRPDDMLKTAIVAKTLLARGYKREVDKAAALGQSQWPTTAQVTGRQPTAYSRHLACLLDGGGYARLHDPFGAVDIFEALVRYKRRVADNEIVRLETNIRTIKRYDAAGAAKVADARVAESSVRNVFWLVSKTREQVASNTFFDKEDSYRSSGLELEPAMIRLLDDVVIALRRVENDLYRTINNESGIGISATVLNERAVVDQRVEVKWLIQARGSESIEIRSAEVIRGQEVDTLVRADDGIVVKPGEPRALFSSFPARLSKLNTLRPWNLTLSLTDGKGRRIRYNALRSVYLEQPVQAVASFPEGQILRGLSLPIDIKLVKQTAAHVNLEGVWYSPSGLQLKEGKRFMFTMPSEQDTALVRVNVLVPSPCRPGSFPVKLKFIGNGKDLGTITTSFFKPYQWLFIGPFEPAEHAISTPYPPEKVVDLRKDYAGIGRRITWQVFPDFAGENFGEVQVGRLLSAPGVGYLYTVVEASIEKQCPVFLASNSPAVLYVNDVRILAYDPGPDRVAAEARVGIRRGMNNILIKVAGDNTTRVFFKLGDDDNLASDEFNNNLWELVGDFGEFQERSRRIQAGETEDVRKLHTLRYTDPNANSVSVIGTFNGWSPENATMRRAGKGAWEITLSLLPGKYAYRFLVNNRKQILDPSCPYEEPDGYGGKNSVIYVMK